MRNYVVLKTCKADSGFFLLRGTDCRSRLHGFAMTKRYVILSAEHERIRIPLEKERIAAAVCTASQ